MTPVRAPCWLQCGVINFLPSQRAAASVTPLFFVVVFKNKKRKQNTKKQNTKNPDSHTKKKKSKKNQTHPLASSWPWHRKSAWKHLQEGIPYSCQAEGPGPSSKISVFTQQNMQAFSLIHQGTCSVPYTDLTRKADHLGCPRAEPRAAEGSPSRAGSGSLSSTKYIQLSIGKMSHVFRARFSY